LLVVELLLAALPPFSPPLFVFPMYPEEVSGKLDIALLGLDKFLPPSLQDRAAEEEHLPGFSLYSSRAALPAPVCHLPLMGLKHLRQ
jgi:hypothetical protein